MPRRPPRVLVAASAILLAAVVGLWVRSYWVADGVYWDGFRVTDELRDRPDMLVTVYTLTNVSRAVQSSRGGVGVSCRWQVREMDNNERSQAGGLALAWSLDDGLSAGTHSRPGYYAKGGYSAGSRHHAFPWRTLGFWWERGHDVPRDWGGWWVVNVPYWFLALLAALPLVWRFGSAAVPRQATAARAATT